MACYTCLPRGCAHNLVLTPPRPRRHWLNRPAAFCQDRRKAARSWTDTYEYCRRQSIVPFIALNEKRGVKLKYKNDFTIGPDGIPVCMAGLKMRHDGVEVSKHRSKFRCPLMDRRTRSCSCVNPCSDAKWGRTVHLAMKDNPRLINIPPRDSEEWKIEYNARTSSERCNKRMKYDFQLENGHHRSSKM